MIPRQHRTIVGLILALLLVVGGALAHVTVRLNVIRLGYAITEQTRERRELEEQNRRLRVELALLRGPERIERLAHDKLGMIRPDPTEIRVLRKAEIAAGAGAVSR